MQIKTLKELERIIQKEVQDIISSDESNANELVKEYISDRTKDLVYDRYEPKKYKRRGDDGGLSDISNIRTVGSEATEGDMVKVTFAQEVVGNFTGSESTNDLAPVINEGWGDKEAPYNKPSRHLDYIRENIGSIRGDFINAIKFDLWNKGYDIK